MPDTEDYLFERLPKARLSEIEPLWSLLNAHHAGLAHDFHDHFATLTFAQRMRGLEALDEECLLILVAGTAGARTGYVIAAVRGGDGEIESLFVTPSSRGHGIGAQLAGQALAWLRERSCSVITVTVAAGNEGVLPFYESLGFRPRRMQLELVRP